MNDAIRRFKTRISAGDEVVFFYAGHGVELSGANYLLPTDVGADSPDHVKDDAVALQRVLADLSEARPRFTLIIIDACRDNPFEGLGRNVPSRGLIPTVGAKGQMVIYSAGHGQRALDRLSERDPSPNGVFTRVFVEEIGRSGQTVRDVVSNVREEVVRLTSAIGHEQVPSLYDRSAGSISTVIRFGRQLDQQARGVRSAPSANSGRRCFVRTRRSPMRCT